MKIHHVGIVCSDISKTIYLYEKIGYELQGDIVIDNHQNNKIAFLSNGLPPLLELVEPMDFTSTVANCKEGYHHICYEVEDDFVETFRRLKVGKIFTGELVAPAINNRKVIFAYLKNKTLVEFILEDKIEKSNC